MRIAWLTPLSKRTGVAKYSMAAVAAIRDEHEVDVWAEPAVDNLSFGMYAILADDEATRIELAGYDLIVFNIGNNVSFHDVIYSLSRDLAGLVILHDKVLQDLVFPHYVERRKDLARYLALMARFYGPDGLDYAILRVRGLATDEDSARFPAFELGVHRAAGVLTHSDDAASLFDRYPGVVPVGRANLVFPAWDGPLPERQRIEPPDSSVSIVMHGNVVPSKRAESVLRAYAGSSQLRRASRLSIVGGISAPYGGRLRALSDSLDIGDLVEFTGRVDEATMHRYLSEADIFVNLRHPSTEVASGALLEQIRLGRPVIVSDVGFYSELSDAVAIKVGIENEVDDLRSALELLVADSGLRSSMGAAAERFGREAFSAEAYRVAFCEIAKRTRDALPLILRLRAESESLALSPPSQWAAGALDVARAVATETPPL